MELIVYDRTLSEPERATVEEYLRLKAGIPAFFKPEAEIISDWEVVTRLAEYHRWTEDVVRDRFDCGDGESRIHCALVRVWKAAEPWEITYEKKYGGCRSWVELPEPPEGWKESLVPVVSDEVFGSIRSEVEELL